MPEEKVKRKVKVSIRNNPEAVEYIKQNYKKKTIKEIAEVVEYEETTIRNYIAMYLTATDTLSEDLKRYYLIIKNIFEKNGVVVGRIKTNLKELRILARLKKEKIINLTRERMGVYTVILLEV